MDINRSAAMQLMFPSLADGRTRRRERGFSRPGGGRGRQRRRRLRTGNAQYDQQIQKLNDFFDSARQYQKERGANAPGSSAI